MRDRGLSDAASTLADARRILVVRLDNIGDVVLLSPALVALRAAAPTVELTLLASPAGALAGPLLPQLDRVIQHRASWQQLAQGTVDPEAEIALIDRLRAEAFDAAIIFTSFSQSPIAPAFLCYLAGIPLRAAYAPGQFSGEVITHPVDPDCAPEHQAERGAYLVASLGVPVGDAALRIEVPADARQAAVSILAAEGMEPGDGFVALVPGASAPARRYEPSRFASAARRYADAGHRVLILGSDREVALASEIEAKADHPGVRALAGKTDVPVMAALIERARLVIANNSLALHLADSLGVPVLATYAGTDPADSWAPRHTPHRLLTRPVPCAPCFRIECDRGHECLDIDPRDLVAAGEELLEPVGVGSTQGRLR